MKPVTYESIPVHYAVVIFKNGGIKSTLLKKMLIDRQHHTKENAKIKVLDHVSGHPNKWAESVVRKTPKSTKEPTWLEHPQK